MTPLCPRKDFTDLTQCAGTLGREPTQGQWYRTVGEYLQQYGRLKILDVGAGTCESVPELEKYGHLVMTQDRFPDSKADFRFDANDLPSKCFDCCTAFDVIEHVEDYWTFLLEIKIIARRFIAISTPNYYVSHNTHVYHVREFCPHELPQLGDEMGLKLVASWCQLPGRGIFPVTRSELEACKDTHGYCLVFSV